MGKDVIIACDFSSKKEVMDFLSRFKEKKPYVKIGMELYYAEGPDIVKQIKSMGHKIFLDLKLHDIPNTVMRTMKVLSNLNIDMINLHAAGTIAMMKAAVQGLTRADGTRPLLIAVTQLTSTDEERMHSDILIEKTLDEVVMHYAKNAKIAGLDGVVCSPLEAAKVHQVCGMEFLTVTPGIRFADGNTEDQVRVTTPVLAREKGSDYIVVGRPITAAKDPVEAYERCMKDFIGQAPLQVNYGIGVGMILRKGFSFGGTDTIAKILNKKLFPSINVSYIMLVLDGIVIMIAAFTFGRNIALYSIISQFIVTKVCDYTMFGFGTKLYKLEIISTKYEEISNYIMYELGRGVTLFKIKGCYTNEEKVQIESICSPNQTVMIQELIKNIEPTAFVKVLPVLNVWGKGRRFIDISLED